MRVVFRVSAPRTFARSYGATVHSSSAFGQAIYRGFFIRPRADRLRKAGVNLGPKLFKICFKWVAATDRLTVRTPGCRLQAQNSSSSCRIWVRYMRKAALFGLRYRRPAVFKCCSENNVRWELRLANNAQRLYRGPRNAGCAPLRRALAIGSCITAAPALGINQTRRLVRQVEDTQGASVSPQTRAN